jgi:hypothetical protein
MKELNVNQLENLEGGRFWGSETNCVYGDCTKTCYKTKYRFWFDVGTELDSFELTC